MPRVTFPIHHTFGPLVTREQFWLAFWLQFKPQKWVRGKEIEELRSKLSHHFGMSASLFASGREALLAALQSIAIKPGDEIIIQAFTCMVVPNAVHASGATAVYVDIDPGSLNIDLQKIQAKITPRTRAIICQHTFGIPADTERLRSICDKRNILLIEDLAHVIPDTPDAIGTRGDLLILSFGRDKAISGVMGGAVLTRHGMLGKKLAELEEHALKMPLRFIAHLIGYPLRYRAAKILWSLPFGANLAKAYLRFSRALHLLPQVYQPGEADGKMSVGLRAIPNACVVLILQQFQDLPRLNRHRNTLTQIYSQAAKAKDWNLPQAALTAPSLQKFPVFARNTRKLRAALKREQIYLDDGWCHGAINPASSNQEAAGYAQGSCPVAEEVAAHIVTLPTHPTMAVAQAEYLLHALQSFLA
ncbi:MAG TPA: aminotransferase class I/II-fold pyridoxal phosphate-dependent enzyme [Candidatus Peribacterales bacterium]|nr:aminotransferase class I/II-fold pyridoxal phosphate-dependent enzyme [Candidatus Peribacterales bacterium]